MNIGRAIDRTLRDSRVPNWMYAVFGAVCLLTSGTLYYLSHEFVPQKQFSEDSNDKKATIASLTQKLTDLELNQRALLAEQVHFKESLNHVDDKMDRMIQMLIENRKLVTNQATYNDTKETSGFRVERCNTAHQ